MRYRVLGLKRSITSLFFLAMIVFYVAASYNAVAQVADVRGGKAVVLIDKDGVVEVSLTIYTDPELDEAFRLDLPVPMIQESLEVSPLEVIAQPLPNGSLAILKPKGVDSVEATYIGLVEIVRGVARVEINVPQWLDRLTVKIHRSIIPITFPENISDLKVFGEYILMQLPQNSSWVLEYVLVDDVATGDEGNQGQGAVVVTGATRPQDTQVEPGGSGAAGDQDDGSAGSAPAIGSVLQQLPILLAIALVASGVVGGLIYYLRFVRGRGPLDVDSLLSLDSTDKQIIDAIDQYGEITAKDLIDVTGLPKSTLYRRLKKLSDMGIVGSKVKGGVTYYYKIGQKENE